MKFPKTLNIRIFYRLSRMVLKEAAFKTQDLALKGLKVMPDSLMCVFILLICVMILYLTC
jgi:hypothetical protein